MFSNGLSFLSRVSAATLFWLAANAVVLLAYVPPVAAQEAVCAEVRIEIRQKVSLERQAFDAVLRIRNGLATGSVEDVSVDVLFSDIEGNPVLASSDPNNTAASFFLRLDDLDGIDTLDGTGSVAPESTAAIRWLIIPSATAGGSTPTGVVYMIGARLQYRINGEETTVDVVPETITVRPQPRLALDYFLAGDVYSDDAFTPEVEPPVPFTLGVRVRNIGAGTGQKVSIESAQPQIVDNEQGLLVGFSIVGSHVDDRPAVPSLQIDFGDIPAGGVRMGRWLMETTLSGRFISIDATYTHADVLGGALTSLIDGEPATHLLVRDVLADLPGRDGIRDFLARDGDILRVYESNGVDSEVTDHSSVATLTSMSGSQQYSLSFPLTTGFSYVRVADPTHGATTGLRVQRADGRLLPTENAWFSKSRIAGSNWAYFINVFDSNGGGDYTVMVDAPPANGVLSGSVYVDLNGNGSRDTGEAALDGVGLVLTGGSVIGTVQRSAITQDGGSYQFSDLPEGIYTIAVGDLAPYGNGIHRAGSAGGVVETGRIAQITLGADVYGDGYVFAKTPPDSTGVADLQLVALEGQTSVVIGEPTSIIVRVRNVGPQAALTRTTIVLPEHLSIGQALPSVGNFNQGTGQWDIGVLLPGEEQDLAIEGSYTELGSWLLTAVIHSSDDATDDPDASNNSQVLEVQVEPSPILSMEIEPAPRTDLLFWISCPEDAAPGCAEDRAQRWTDLLTQAGVPHRLEVDAVQFIDALRSGEWPSVWIDGGLGLGQGTIAAEIRESARRGGALIVSGSRNPAWSQFEALTGATHASDLPSGARMAHLLQNEYFDAGVLTADGTAAVYAVGAGRVLAEYEPGMPAIVSAPTNAPAPVIVFGFDPLFGIEADADPGQFLGALATGARVSMPSVVLDGSRLPFQTRARRPNAMSDELALVVGFPEVFSVLDADPIPTSSTSGSLSWVAPWPADAVFEVNYALRAPGESGTYTLNGAVQWQGEEDDDEFIVYIRDRQDQLAFATSALDELQASDAGDLALKQQAATHLAAAQAAYLQGNQTTAIAELIAALDALDEIAAPGARDVALEVSRLLLAMSREAPVVTVDLFSDGFENTP